jgi:gliding motility-associated-like protein
MRKTLLLLLFIFCKNMLLAQSTHFKWAKSFSGGDGVNLDWTTKVRIDSSGNVYTTGHFTGTMDFDPGPGVFNLTSKGLHDIFISKLDANGNFVWAKQLGNTDDDANYVLNLDLDGNIYMVSTFSQTMDFDPGPATYPVTPAFANDVFILKLSNNGNFIWVKEIMGDKIKTPRDIAIDKTGDFYLVGGFAGTADFDPGPAIFNLTAKPPTGPIFFPLPPPDIFIAKFNSNGNFVWAKAAGGNGGDGAFRISISSNGYLILTGTFSDIADLDPGPGTYNITSNGMEDGFIMKLNMDGDLIWAKAIGGPRTDVIYSPKTDGNDNVYVTGFYQNSADLDPGPAVLSVTTPGDAIVILKLDVNGNLVWARSMGGPSYNNWGYDLALDNEANVYVTGFFFGPVDFDPGPGTFILNSLGQDDAYFLRLTEDGDFVWARSIGGPQDEQGLSIVLDKFKNIYVAGHFGGAVDFDPDAPVYNLTADNGDPYVVKIAQCPVTSYAVINKAACDSFTLNGQTYKTNGIYTQVLYNAAGCDSIITLNLTIHNTAFTATSPVICQGQSYFAGGSNQTASGVYKDTLQTTFGCDSIITTHLNVWPAPTPDLGPDRNICAATTISLSPGTFDNYTWQDNSTQSTFTVNSTGKYWVTVSSINTCSATDTINILAVDTTPVHFLPPGQELCYGAILKIAVPGYKDYLWSNGQITNIVTLSSFGKFYLTVTDFNNCKGKDSITLIRKDCIPIGIPNAFTPNGDAKNEVFKPTINQEIRNYSFMVYNRYGEKIFDTRSYGIGWDGTYKGKPQPIGTYVYQIVFTNIFGFKSENKGTVMLLR